MYIHKQFAFRCSTYEVDHDTFGRVGGNSTTCVIRRRYIIEFIQILDKTRAVLIVEEYLPLVDATI